MGGRGLEKMEKDSSKSANRPITSADGGGVEDRKRRNGMDGMDDLGLEVCVGCV